MSEQDKARAVADKLRKEKEEKEAGSEKNIEAAKSQLAAIQANSNLAAMYNESANVGAENIGGQSLPILRVHSAGKSTTNELEDGSEPGDGHFFYKPTKQDLGKEIDVHILTISRGYYTAPMEGSVKDKIWNQIVGGIIGTDKPFMMYFTGSKLQNLWNFGKEASQYTKRKPVAFPMFSLKIQLTTRKGEKGQYAAPWLVDFTIFKTEEGNPELVMDEGEFQYLKDNVSTMEETIAGVIASKELKSPTAATSIDAEPINGEEVESNPFDGVDADEIPFN